MTDYIGPFGPNPAGICHCGCGAKTSIAKHTDPRTGTVKGHPLKWVHGHAVRYRNVPFCGYIAEDRGYDTPCWIWKLSKTKKGYGTTWRDGRLVGSHVALWEDANGPVPHGLQLDHLCCVIACVNPEHLEPVTGIENLRRSQATKLTPEQAAEIRASSSRGADLAVKYGVSATHVSAIRTGRRWAT